MRELVISYFGVEIYKIYISNGHFRFSLMLKSSLLSTDQWWVCVSCFLTGRETDYPFSTVKLQSVLDTRKFLINDESVKNQLQPQFNKFLKYYTYFKVLKLFLEHINWAIIKQDSAPIYICIVMSPFLKYLFAINYHVIKCNLHTWPMTTICKCGIISIFLHYLVKLFMLTGLVKSPFRIFLLIDCTAILCNLDSLRHQLPAVLLLFGLRLRLQLHCYSS